MVNILAAIETAIMEAWLTITPGQSLMLLSDCHTEHMSPQEGDRW